MEKTSNYHKPNYDSVENGDRVKVSWNDEWKPAEGVVLHIPDAYMNMWILKVDTIKGISVPPQIMLINPNSNSFDTMIVLEKWCV
jgi:hypothetical protein